MPDLAHSDVPNRADHLYLEVTGRCNLNCPHCAVRSWEKNPQDPDYEVLATLLSDFRAQGGHYVTFSGGEPGLRTDLPDLISKAADLGLSVTLYTNGLAVTDGVLESLQGTSGLIAVSLDGPNADIHEQMRGRGTYAQALARFEKAVVRLGGHRVMLSCILSKPLLPHTDQLWEFARSHGVGALYLNLFEPLKMYAAHSLAPAAHELIGPVLGLLDAAEKEDGIRLLFSESHDLICIKSVFSERDERKILGRTVKVQADGWAYPGPFLY